MDKTLKRVLLFTLLTFSSYFLLISPKDTKSQVVSSPVLSEVQLATESEATFDFIELYNPSSEDMSLEGMRLAKRSSTGTSSSSIVAFSSTDSIPAHGFFLWCNTNLAATTTCDKSTGATVSDDNSVAILNGSLADGVVVDAVTFGSPAAPFGEGTFLTAPLSGTSVERKANASSTSDSMSDPLLDGLLGNGYDTNDNSADFVTRLVPDPQNTNSEIEPSTSVTPTMSLTPTPTETTTPTQTNTPTPTESLTPSPSESPTPNPTESMTPTPTESSVPTPTLTPTPTATPTPVENVVAKFTFSNYSLICKIIYKPYSVLFLKGFMPTFSCTKQAVASQF